MMLSVFEKNHLKMTLENAGLKENSSCLIGSFYKLTYNFFRKILSLVGKILCESWSLPS